MLKSLLERHTFDVVSAFDYAEALNQIERNSSAFALAIVDLQLVNSNTSENRSGLDVLKKLREKSIYAIVLSAYTNEQAIELSQRPEVHSVADKIRFAEGEYDDFFIAKVKEALEHATLDRAIEQPHVPQTLHYFEQGRALIVGVANYQDPNVPTLPDVVLKDVRDVGYVLTDSQRCGYLHSRTKQLLDEQATKQNICQELADLAKSSHPEDTVIIFFSGHGQCDESHEYILPWDINSNNLAETAISDVEMAAMLDKIPAERLLVILDSCHSGGATAKAKNNSSSEFQLDEDYYKMLAQGRGQVVMASCGPDESSYILPGMANSLFTHALLMALNGEVKKSDDGYLRIFELWEHLSTYVTEKATKAGYKQNPLLRGTIEDNFPIAIHASIYDF